MWTWLIVGIVIGFILGALGADIKWVSNSKNIQRIECWGKLYKVVNVEDKKSWEYLNIHKDDVD